MSRGSLPVLGGQVLARKDTSMLIASARATPAYGVSQSKQHKDRLGRPQRDPGSQSQAELLLNSDPEAPSLVFLSINRQHTLLSTHHWASSLVLPSIDRGRALLLPTHDPCHGMTSSLP